MSVGRYALVLSLLPALCGCGLGVGIVAALTPDAGPPDAGGDADADADADADDDLDAGGPPPFAPPRADAVALWLRADDDVVAVDGSVTSWRTRLPEGGAAPSYVGADGFEPTLESGGGPAGRPAVRFDGDQVLSTTEPTSISEGLVFLVAAVDESVAAYGAFLAGGTTSSTFGVVSESVLRLRSDDLDVDGVGVFSGESFATWRLYELTFAPSQVTVSWGGNTSWTALVSRGDAGPDDPFFTIATLGAAEDVTRSDALRGRIAEVLVFDAPLTQEESGAVREYLRDRYEL